MTTLTTRDLVTKANELGLEIALASIRLRSEQDDLSAKASADRLASLAMAMKDIRDELATIPDA